MKKISVIVVGAGNRGDRYAELMNQMPDQYAIVGMADPAEARQIHFQQAYGVSAEQCYGDWKEILSRPKFADVAVIATVDNMHYEPALLAIEQGYDLLLEKPVAPTAKECADILSAARRKGVKVLVCHVLRYSPFYGRVKELLMSGIIGEVMSIDQVEGIGNVHFSHSYVRGNWHNTSTSAPMLLAKSCHDLDIIQWLLDKPCQRVSSFGSLTHFTPENAPEGAPVRCADGTCPAYDTCPYNVIKHYYDFKTNTRREIITKGIAKDYVPTDEEVMTALKTTNYGICAYHSDNDVLDHQVVSMEFAGGATANLTVNAFNRGGRYIRLYGTKGEIYAHMRDKEIQVYTFEDKKTTMVPVVKTEETIDGGHGGGDGGIVKEMYAYFAGEYTGFRAADLDISVQNHMIGFAAEEARLNRTVVDVQEMIREYGL
jgi:predicted dehydrogenase